ncbi:aspartate ammonia-lyase [Candidatus Binatia bacterium]|nr:aspartate ammonia-lyase [Candidatus Binatia bacterium]
MSGATRVESDALGSVSLPARALYGVRTARALADLSFSGRRLGSYREYVAALATVKQAAARANHDAAVLPGNVADAIENACVQLRGGAHHNALVVDVLGGGGGVAVNMNVNEVIANLANIALGGEAGVYLPVDPKRHVNASQSTADVCHTGLRLAVLDRGDRLAAVLHRCVAVLQAQAATLAGVRTLARTCLQDALPASLGDLFRGYAAAVERRAAALGGVVEALNMVNLGGTVIGDGAGAPPAYRARVLDHLRALTGREVALRPDLGDAAQNCDDLAAVAAELALLAEVLIKVAQDLRLLSSGPAGGFDEIRVPATQEGSSFFPGKINPVLPETLLHCCMQVLGCERAARLALERAELNLNVFEPVVAVNVLDALEMLNAALGSFTEKCLVGLTANPDRCAALAATVPPRD